MPSKVTIKDVNRAIALWKKASEWPRHAENWPETPAERNADYIIINYAPQFERAEYLATAPHLNKPEEPKTPRILITTKHILKKLDNPNLKLVRVNGLWQYKYDTGTKVIVKKTEYASLTEITLDEWVKIGAKFLKKIGATKAPVKYTTKITHEL